ncbi:transcription elongation factor 1 homolog [Nephila pilipes]|uniref:Transcription elongation factor 1 homolog n=1 Tax=Nephila pilipes TaxID=299642 RepID=A0A8X6T265_NEPPI|nr:transcription elongation factor 1 homolog [Nephila pilipes]
MAFKEILIFSFALIFTFDRTHSAPEGAITGIADEVANTLNDAADSIESLLDVGSGEAGNIERAIDDVVHQRNQRLRVNTLRQREARQRATNARRGRNQQRMQNHGALTRTSFNRLAFEYDLEIDYSSLASSDALIIIGNMDKECQHCHAFKYKGESAGLCCASGKVSLPSLNPPPEPSKTLLAGATSQSK